MENKEQNYIEALEKFKSGNYEKSSELFIEILNLDRKNHKVYNLLGLSFYYLKNSDLAIKNFSLALEFNPNNIDYLINLARVYVQINDTNEAKKILNKAINFNSTELKLYRELASLLYSEKLFEESLNLYLKIISLSPNEHQAYNNCGLIFTKLRQFNKAYQFIEKAISLDSGNAQYYFNMTLALMKECEDFFSDNYLPNSYQHYQELSNNFLTKMDYAVAYALKSTKISPYKAEYHNYLGNAYLKKELTEKDCNNALICFKNAISLNSKVPEYYSNIAYTYNELGLYQEALDYYSKLKTISPIISANAAYFQIKMTNCEKGIYDLEVERAFYNNLPKGLFYDIKEKYNKPHLEHNVDLSNKVVYVIKEGGAGDEIQFLRFLKCLKNKGAYIKLLCSSILKNIFDSFEYIDEIILSQDDVVDFDYVTSLLSLPSLVNDNSYRMDYYNFFPYLKTPENKKDKWKSFFSSNTRKKIAFTWKSRFPSYTFYKRSTDFNFFYKLAKDFPEIDFFSIQKGHFESEFHNNDNLNNIFDLSYEIEDFSDSAGILDNVDLLISIDSAILHLSGAMNRPVFMLVPYSGDWRWPISDDKTFWYPSMDIIRQTEIGNWQTVFDQVKDKLKHLT